jgi:prepilin-type N-terminal cleavage/methylation domain-containing protein
MKRKNKGFTLLELLVSLSILVVIIAVSINLFSRNEVEITAETVKILREGMYIAQTTVAYKIKYGKWPGSTADNLRHQLIPEFTNKMQYDWSMPGEQYDKDVNGDGIKDRAIFLKGINKNICEKIRERSEYKKIFVLYAPGGHMVGEGGVECDDTDNKLYVMAEAG